MKREDSEKEGSYLTLVFPNPKVKAVFETATFLGPSIGTQRFFKYFSRSNLQIKVTSLRKFLPLRGHLRGLGIQNREGGREKTRNMSIWESALIYGLG